MDSEQLCENLLSLMSQVSLEVDAEKRALTQAELLRQLGRFDDALAILDQPMLANNDASLLIAKRARNKDTKVFKLSEWSSLSQRI